MPEQQTEQVSMDDYVKARSAGETVTETPAATTPEKENVKTESESATDNLESEEGEKPKSDGGWQRRVDKLTKKFNASESARIAAEAKLAERAPAESVKDKPIEPGARPEPKSTDLGTDGKPKYADYDDFLRDVRKWDKEQLLLEVDNRGKQQTEKQEQAKQEKFVTDSFQNKAKAAEGVHADFKDVVFGEDSPVTEGKIVAGSLIDGFILDPDNEGLEVLYHLCKNPAEIERISELSPQKQIRELGKIEDAILADRKSEDSPPPKKAALPAPIKPVHSGTSKSTVKLAEMSMEDYAKARKAGQSY
jgi:hypothetical protein